MKKTEDRVAIVTGAGGMRGIGRSIALRLVRNGVNVALVDIQRQKDSLPQDEIEAGWEGIESVHKEISALGGKSTVIYADISNAAQVSEATELTISTLGQVDYLVNNARAFAGGDRVPVAELPAAEWDRVMSVNARGTFLFSREVARHLVGRRAPGRIINMSSLSGKRGLANHAAYSASKFAINGLTQALALELGPHGITVNSVCPGAVDTGRFSPADQVQARQLGQSLADFTAERLVRRAQSVALGRVATPEDVAGVVAFLVSRDAGHVTGQAINVDGGEVFH